MKKTVLELRLVVQDEKGNEISHYCCDRAVAFKKFDGTKAEKYIETIQSIAQAIGKILGFSVY